MLIRKSLPHLFIGFLSAGFVACGSFETVDSKDVPLRQRPSKTPGELPELLPVPDIHQKYSLSYSQENDKTTAVAQFRVRDNYGDTIRFGRTDQIQFGGKAMSIVDGDHFGPVLGLFQGTFYTLSLAGKAEGSFVLLDDLGNRVDTPLRVPKLEVTAPPVKKKGITLEGPYVVALQTDAALSSAQISCLIHSSWSDAEGVPQTSQTSARGKILATGEGECSFSEADLQQIQSPTGVIELRVDLSIRARSEDDWERIRETSVSHSLNRTLETVSAPEDEKDVPTITRR